MKKLYSLWYVLFLFFVIICHQATAQGIYQLWGTTYYGGQNDDGVLFTTRHDGTGQVIKKDFGAVNPGKPSEFNKPVAFNNKLYTVLKEGGLSNQGIISEYDPATGSYSKKADLFTIGTAAGEGTLILYNGRLYGITTAGGAFGEGVLFEFNPSTNELIKKHDFDMATGWNPYSSLTVYNNKLYGITSSGGANDLGVIYEFNPATNSYTVRKNMDNATTGGYCVADFIIYNNKLWTVSSTGGPGAGDGVVFSYDPVTNAVSPKAVLGDIGGNGFYGSLALLNNKFYGVTNSGGTFDIGLLFEFDPATSALAKKMDFTPATIQRRCELTPFNNKLYGNALSGGPGGGGGIFTYDPATSIYSLKVDFAQATGWVGAGEMLLFNDKFYGFTSGGGPAGEGALFEYDPDFNGYAIKAYFGSVLNKPNGSLLYYNNKIYGTLSSTNMASANYGGAIYEYDMTTGIYTIKLNIQANDGTFVSQSGFILYNHKFYGVTVWGGANDGGVLFEYDPVTNVYTKKYDFEQASGYRPYGGLVALSGKLYGTTSAGAADDAGTLFEFDLNTGTYSNKVVFSNNWGKTCRTGLTLYNGKLYGLTADGGADFRGTLFEYNPAINSFVKRYDLQSATTGMQPYGSLVILNNKLYAATPLGGANASGVLFEYDPATYAVTKKWDFEPGSGGVSISTMTVLNNKLYGTGRQGGTLADGGVIYEYNPATNTYASKLDFIGANGREPHRTPLLPVPAPVAPGIPGACSNTSTVNITAANSHDWIPFTDEEGRAVAEINANGNILGNTTVRYFIHDGSPRKDQQDVFYLDRNLTITADNQPATPVDLRLYVQQSEFQSLKNTPGSGVTVPSHIAVFHNNDFCSPDVYGKAAKLPTTVAGWATDYVYSTSVSSFSSFYFATNTALTLPVHIESFTGKHTPSGNQLTWKASCTDAVDFTLERSTDGIHFSAITTIKATQSDCANPFTYTDASYKPGNSYYRLAMNEAGNITYSQIVLLETGISNPLALKVMPNPVSGKEVTLQITASTKKSLQIMIIDIAGRVVLNRSLQVPEGVTNRVLDISGLPGGLYHIRCSDGNEIQVVKMVKQ